MSNRNTNSEPPHHGNYSPLEQQGYGQFSQQQAPQTPQGKSYIVPYAPSQFGPTTYEYPKFDGKPEFYATISSLNI